jgi:hypothetical protein
MICVVLGLYTLSWCWYRCLERGTSSIDRVELSRFYLKMETESSLRNVVLYKNRTTDNIKKHKVCTGRKYLFLKITYYNINNRTCDNYDY